MKKLLHKIGSNVLDRITNTLLWAAIILMFFQLQIASSFTLGLTGLFTILTYHAFKTEGTQNPFYYLLGWVFLLAGLSFGCYFLFDFLIPSNFMDI